MIDMLHLIRVVVFVAFATGLMLTPFAITIYLLMRLFRQVPPLW